MRASLTVVQVALSIVLLINAGLFLRSLHNVRALDASFDFEHLLVVSTPSSVIHPPSASRRPRRPPSRGSARFQASIR